MLCRKCKTELPDEAVFCLKCGVKQIVTRNVRRRGNGTGSVYRTKSGNWQAEIVIGKKANMRPDRRTKGGFKTKKEALDYIPILMGQANKKKDKCTLATLYAAWSTSALEKLSSSRQTAYRIAWGKIEGDTIIHAEIRTLTIENLQHLVDDNAETYYPARDIKTLLSHLYKRACAQQDVISNLSTYIVLPPLKEAEQQPFTEEEIRKMWVAYEQGDTFAGYLLLMIYSGMMPGELRNIMLGMVDFEAHTITGAGIKTKERQRTPITISDIIAPVLEDLMAHASNDKLLDVSKNDFYDMYHQAIKRIGCRDLPAYSCRHSTATALAIGQNVAPEIIRRIMRWSSTKMLSRYAHDTVSDRVAALNRLNSTPNYSPIKDAKVP